MRTDSLKNKHRKNIKAWDYPVITAVLFEAVKQTKLPYDVKLHVAQKYWRQTSAKSGNDFSIYG